MTLVALVTGASSGIGAATARRLARAGFVVYGAARRLDRLAALEGEGVRPLALDVTDDASMVAAVERVVAEQGRIDVLVNNAGYGSYGAVEDVPQEEARRQIEVNLFGLARLIQLVLPAMRAQGSGRIVNVTSMGGRIATAFGGWYHASKHAVEGLSDSLRQEVARFGIDVVVIEPGGIRTGGVVSRHGPGSRPRRTVLTASGLAPRPQCWATPARSAVAPTRTWSPGRSSAPSRRSVRAPVTRWAWEPSRSCSPAAFCRTAPWTPSSPASSAEPARKRRSTGAAVTSACVGWTLSVILIGFAPHRVRSVLPLACIKRWMRCSKSGDSRDERRRHVRA